MARDEFINKRNPVANPDFDDGLNYWTAEGPGGAWQVLPLNSGPRQGDLVAAGSAQNEPSDDWNTLTSDPIDVRPGSGWGLRFWAIGARFGADFKAEAQVEVAPGLGFTHYLDIPDGQTDAGAFYVGGLFKALGPVRVRFRIAEQFAAAFIAIDVVELLDEETMALLLGERSRKQIGVILQDRLPEELAKIERERADGVGLMRPEGVLPYQQDDEPRARTEQLTVEVYRRSPGVQFPNWNADAGGFDSKGIVSWQSALQVAISHANRDNLSRAQMEDRSDRYAAAVIRLLRDDPFLSRPEFAVTADSVDSIRQPALSAYEVDTVLVNLTVRGAENKIGEGVDEGGVAPKLQPSC